MLNFGNHMINTNAARQFVPDGSSMWEFLCPYLVTILQPSHAADKLWRFPQELGMTVCLCGFSSVFLCGGGWGRKYLHNCYHLPLCRLPLVIWLRLTLVTKEVCNTWRKWVFIFTFLFISMTVLLVHASFCYS